MKQIHTRLRNAVRESDEPLRESERRYRILIETATQGILVVQDNQCKLLNPKVSELTGYSREELMRIPFSEIVYIEDRELVSDNLNKLICGETADSGFHFRIIKTDLEIQWFETTGIHTDWEGRPAVLCFITNITARKKVEDALRESETRLNSILDNLNDVVMLLSWPELNIVYMGRSMEKLYGRIGPEFIENPNLWTAVVHPDDRHLVETAIAQLQHQGYAEHESRIVRSDGGIVWINSRFKLLYNRDNVPISVQGIIADITPRKMAEAEIRMRGEILEHMEEGVLLIRAADEIIVYTNPKADLLFGFDPGELVGKPIGILYISPERRGGDPVNDRLWLINIHKEWQGETQMIKKDGCICWVHASVSAFEHPQFGSVWISIYTDITGRRLAEESMLISEEKYRTTLNASPDGILLIDLKGNISEISEIGLELFGADNKDELLGKSFSWFIPPEEQDALKEIIDRATSEGLVQNVRIKVRKKNQSLFVSETTATLIQGADGEPLSFMVFIRDISNRHKMETRQIHADRMANLGEMAAGIAHEINQPLNIISMVVDKILFETTRTETVDIEFLRNKSDKIFENITRIRNIIDHVRAFSRSHDDYVLSAFDINASIENATTMLTEQFKHLGISLDLVLDKDISLIFGNTLRFEQVIINFLLNAKDAVIERKVMQEDYTDMRVGICSYQENQSLIVEVTDNGIGISHGDIEKIMLPFYTTKGEGKGTGLGLSICYHIIREMGGTIDITSDGVDGTKIRMVLDIQWKK